MIIWQTHVLLQCKKLKDTPLSCLIQPSAETNFSNEFFKMGLTSKEPKIIKINRGKNTKSKSRSNNNNSKKSKGSAKKSTKQQQNNNTERKITQIEEETKMIIEWEKVMKSLSAVREQARANATRTLRKALRHRLFLRHLRRICAENPYDDDSINKVEVKAGMIVESGVKDDLAKNGDKIEDVFKKYEASLSTNPKLNLHKNTHFEVGLFMYSVAEDATSLLVPRASPLYPFLVDEKRTSSDSQSTVTFSFYPKKK